MRHFDLPPLEGLDPEVSLLAATIVDGTREWRDEFEELGDTPVEALVWPIAPNGYSIGALLLHIAEVEAYWIGEVAAGIPMSPEDGARFMSSEIQQYEGRWPIPHAIPLAEYWAMLEEVRGRTLALLPKLGPPDRVFPHRENTVTLRWILAHVAGHEAYHGGQAVLLRSLWGSRFR